MADPRDPAPNVATFDPADPKMLRVNSPVLDGLAAEVQHALGQGEPAKGPGMIGAGVLILPTGQPRVIVQIKHHDGTCLGAMLKTASDFKTLLDCLVDAHNEATRIAAAAATAPRN